MKNYDEELIERVVTESKPASLIPPESIRKTPVHIKEIILSHHDIWKGLGFQYARQYKKGQMLSQGIVQLDSKYTDILSGIITALFQSLREQSVDNVEKMEDRQEILQRLSAMEALFSASLDNLDTGQFKLDIDSVLCILHGYIDQSIMTKIK